MLKFISSVTNLPWLLENNFLGVTSLVICSCNFARIFSLKVICQYICHHSFGMGQTLASYLRRKKHLTVYCLCDLRVKIK